MSFTHCNQKHATINAQTYNNLMPPTINRINKFTDQHFSKYIHDHVEFYRRLSVLQDVIPGYGVISNLSDVKEALVSCRGNALLGNTMKQFKSFNMKDRVQKGLIGRKHGHNGGNNCYQLDNSRIHYSSSRGGVNNLFSHGNNNNSNQSHIYNNDNYQSYNNRVDGGNNKYYHHHNDNQSHISNNNNYQSYNNNNESSSGDGNPSYSYQNNIYSYNQSRQDSHAPRGFRMIISGFDSNTNRDDIHRFASQAGKSVRILQIYDYKNFITAVASYQSRSEFEYAIKHLDNAKLNGVTVRCYAYNVSNAPTGVSHRLYITGISDNTTWQDVKDFALTAGASVCYVDIYSRHSKKEAVVDYYGREDFEKAIIILDRARLNGPRVHVFDRKPSHRDNDDNDDDNNNDNYRMRSRSRSRDRGRNPDYRRGGDRAPKDRRKSSKNIRNKLRAPRQKIDARDIDRVHIHKSLNDIMNKPPGKSSSGRGREINRNNKSPKGHSNGTICAENNQNIDMNVINQQKYNEFGDGACKTFSLYDDLNIMREKENEEMALTTNDAIVVQVEDAPAEANTDKETTNDTNSNRSTGRFFPVGLAQNVINEHINQYMSHYLNV